METTFHILHQSSLVVRRGTQRPENILSKSLYRTSQIFQESRRRNEIELSLSFGFDCMTKAKGGKKLPKEDGNVILPRGKNKVVRLLPFLAIELEIREA